MEQNQPAFGEQLEELSSLLLRMGGQCEQAIGRAISALSNRDTIAARHVIDGDEDIDKLELAIDSLCMEILVRHQPMARDLRLITTAMKITPDLERIADHAVNICQRTIELNEEPPLNALVDLPLMATHAQQMVHGALDAFVREDADAARNIILMDDELDRRLEQIFRVLLSHMIEDPQTITRCLRTMFIAKYFERIGDQSTNICEQIVYMAEARVIKHGPVDAP
jgi:phosphate transport system protein